MTPLWFWQDLQSPREYLLQKAYTLCYIGMMHAPTPADFPVVEYHDLLKIWREVRGDADRI